MKLFILISTTIGIISYLVSLLAATIGGVDHDDNWVNPKAAKIYYIFGVVTVVAIVISYVLLAIAIYTT